MLQFLKQRNKRRKLERKRFLSPVVIKLLVHPL